MLYILVLCVFFAASETSVLSSLGEIGSLEPNDKFRCLVIKLSSKHFLTTQLCAAKIGKNSRLYHPQISSTVITTTKYNEYYTLGGYNNIATVTTSNALANIKNVKILQTVVKPGQYRVLFIGGETVVTVLGDKVCLGKRFASNNYHVVDPKREICAVVQNGMNKLSDHTIASGAVLLSPNNDHFIGLLSLADAFNDGSKQTLLFTRLPAYCNYLSMKTDNTFKCT
uniref:Peptidase S1 domain-containing protein n=1 Tax=Panagrellus redivivus TaxID=6233 RepID=A0A7E4VZ78_PANRE